MAHRTTPYFAFGLRIASGIRCPEFQEGGGAPEVRIRLRGLPAHLLRAWPPGQAFEVVKDRFLLAIPGVGRFLVEAGQSITVDPDPEADSDLVRVFLLGSAFGALLYQRGCLPLHGSALGGSQGAFVLTGPSGIGKSTLAASMCGRGLPVFSDDVCAVTFPEAGPPLLQPAYPRLHLRPDVLEHVAAESGALFPSRKAVEKFGLEVRASFASAPAPLRAVFLLEQAEVAAPRHQELTGMAKVQALAANTYRPGYLQPMGLLARHFQQVAALAQTARVFKVQRPPHLSSLQPLADLILHLEALPPSAPR